MNPTTVLSTIATPGGYREFAPVIVVNPDLVPSIGDTLISEDAADRLIVGAETNVRQSVGTDRKVS